MKFKPIKPAFVLGNGRSRQEVDLSTLALRGKIYGCNALYRDFTPDVLISTDRPISNQIQQSGYAKEHRMYTRKPIPNLGALPVPVAYHGYSSGPIAVAIAAQDQNNPVYLIGFDLGPLPGQKFNNIYADTEFYKKSTARPTFTGNWIRQIVQIAHDFHTQSFIRVIGETSTTVTEFEKVKNIFKLGMQEFLERINN